MTKETYLELKQELKSLAKTIRKKKQLTKNSQRGQSKYERLVMNQAKDYYWRSHKLDGWYEVMNPARKNQEELLELKAEYRAKHIIYSLERGKTIEEIESKIKDKYDYWYIYVYHTLIPKFVKKYEFNNLNILPKLTLQSIGLIEPNGQIRMFTREEVLFKSGDRIPRRVSVRRLK